jgi:hypothetical protein
VTTVVHKLIKETAQAIAAEAYEGMAHTNEFYAEWPKQSQFVRANWRMFVDHAREQLVKILTGDYSEALKRPVYEALLIDGSFKSSAPTSALHH